MTAAPATVERTIGRLPAGVTTLAAEAEREGVAFVRRLVEDWESGANRFDRPGEALFAAWSDEQLAGVCGLNVDPYVDDRGVGRVRHLYVALAHRRFGVGRALVTAVVDAGRGRFDRLRLSTSNPAAASLYTRLGFRETPGEGHATHVLDLGDGAARPR